MRVALFIPLLSIAGCATPREITPDVLAQRLAELPYRKQEHFGVSELKPNEMLPGQSGPELAYDYGPRPDARGVVALVQGNKAAVRLDPDVPRPLPRSFFILIYSPRFPKCYLLVQEVCGDFLLGSLQELLGHQPVQVGDRAAVEFEQ